jgi:hypothetical protein
MSAFFGELVNLTLKQFEAEVEGFLRRGLAFTASNSKI